MIPLSCWFETLAYLVPPNVLLVLRFLLIPDQRKYEVIAFVALNLFTCASSVIMLRSTVALLDVEASLREANRKMDAMTKTDFLTELCNRRGLNEAVTRLWQTNPAAVVTAASMDIDHFKEFNDCFGHEAGDTCLERVARVIEYTLGDSAEVIARMGGEEFIVLFRDKEPSEIRRLIDAMMEGIAGLQIPAGNPVVSPYVSLSVGIGKPHSVRDARWTDVYEEVDAALYAAKGQGRNCVVSGRRHAFRQPEPPAAPIPPADVSGFPTE